MQALLNEILDEVRPLIGRGKVADYIPALADVAPRSNFHSDLRRRHEFSPASLHASLFAARRMP